MKPEDVKIGQYVIVSNQAAKVLDTPLPYVHVAYTLGGYGLVSCGFIEPATKEHRLLFPVGTNLPDSTPTLVRVACASCGQSGGAGPVLDPTQAVCPECWTSKTRLERVALGWEADPYAVENRPAAHPEAVHDGQGHYRRFGSKLYWARDLRVPPLPPLQVDDPTGDDVAADAPGAQAYLRGTK